MSGRNFRSQDLSLRRQSPRFGQVSQVHVKLIPQINWEIRQDVIHVTVLSLGSKLFRFWWKPKRQDFSQKNKDDQIYVSVYANDHRNSHLEMGTLVGDSLGSAVFDCGATKAVCEITWYNCYLDTLSEMQKTRIQTEESNISFKFGDNRTVEAIKKV